ncbi:MAG: cupredoxin domain-containing protein [Deltaproteobacteria bacterium]|nr:cupredoxin domain-containing protein [Deltaproteobacteria bacterium]
MKTVWTRVLAALVVASGVVGLVPRAARAGEVSVTVVNVETPQGVKVWLPTGITAKKGDIVKLKLVNKLANDHGYSIPAYNVGVIVPAEGPNGNAEITFTADKGGVFPINCQLHPAHVAGQLVVLE